MKTFLLWSIIAAGVVGSGAVYLLFNTSPEKEVVTTTQPVEVAPSEKVSLSPLSGSGSMTALMARGENLECTISYAASSADATQTEGTYFTSGSKMRGDFLVTSSGQQTVSSVIMKDQTLYSWTEIEGEAYGMKIPMAELEASKNTEGAPAAQEVVPMDAEVDYSCKVWTAVDNSIFEPPSDVLFRDFGDIVSMGMEFGNMFEGGEGMGSQCAACDSLSGSEKSQCRAMMSCE